MKPSNVGLCEHGVSAVKHKIPQGARISVLIDGREFVPGRITGIGRVLMGITGALAESGLFERIDLAVAGPGVLPETLKVNRRIAVPRLPAGFLPSEFALSKLTYRGYALFISPYPKVPIFGTGCPSVHIVHDILDLTHQAYRRRIKRHFDAFRLRKALRKADLTWYDSAWSQEETRRFCGFTGKKPKVRHPGIDNRFTPKPDAGDDQIRDRYGLASNTYVLTVGNGLPHKNLGVLLKVSEGVAKDFVFLGVSPKNQTHWKSRYPNGRALWLGGIPDADLPAILRGAFCLAQPSTAEGYGYPPLEAMACGTPAVVSNIPVLLETAGGCALAVDPAKPGEWKHAFDALEDREFRGIQEKKGLQWVEHLKGVRGWQKHLEDIEELLVEVS